MEEGVLGEYGGGTRDTLDAVALLVDFLSRMGYCGGPALSVMRWSYSNVYQLLNEARAIRKGREYIIYCLSAT